MTHMPFPWTNPVIVTNQGGDSATAVAWRFTTWSLTAPPAVPLDTARTLGSEPATGKWVFHLDGDERVPAALGETLQRLVQERGDATEARGGGGI